MSIGEVYLGDGLYASYDGFQIRLRAGRTGGDHEVFLDMDTLMGLLRFVEKLHGIEIKIKKLESQERLA